MKKLFLLLVILLPAFGWTHEGHNKPPAAAVREETKPAIREETKTAVREETKARNEIVPPEKAHAKEAHDHKEAHVPGKEASVLEKIFKFLGNFHPIMLHFPIALIVMTALCELLSVYWPLPLFNESSRFMLLAAAVTAVPTALLGLAYGYGATYEGVLIQIFWWHRLTGLSTAVLTALAATLKELHLRGNVYGRQYYRIALGVIVIVLTVTAYLGAEMTFGLNHLFP